MANETDVHIGMRVREARLAKGMSQTDLGKALGISFQQVQKYEKGTNRISGSRLWGICNALETPVDFLFDGLPKKGGASAVPPETPERRLGRRTIELARELNALGDQCLKADFIYLIRAFGRLG